MTDEFLAAGAPRSAIWRRLKTLTDGWRESAYAYRRGDEGQVNDERADAYENCADDLDTALRACAEAPATTSADEEMVPHRFLPHNGDWVNDIWCKDCAYHRDHAIHVPRRSPLPHHRKKR